MTTSQNKKTGPTTIQYARVLNSSKSHSAEILLAQLDELLKKFATDSNFKQQQPASQFVSQNQATIETQKNVIEESLQSNDTQKLVEQVPQESLRETPHSQSQLEIAIQQYIRNDVTDEKLKHIESLLLICNSDNILSEYKNVQEKSDEMTMPHTIAQQDKTHIFSDSLIATKCNQTNIQEGISSMSKRQLVDLKNKDFPQRDNNYKLCKVLTNFEIKPQIRNKNFLKIQRSKQELFSDSNGNQTYACLPSDFSNDICDDLYPIVESGSEPENDRVSTYSLCESSSFVETRASYTNSLPWGSLAAEPGKVYKEKQSDCTIVKDKLVNDTASGRLLIRAKKVSLRQRAQTLNDLPFSFGSSSEAHMCTIGSAQKNMNRGKFEAKNPDEYLFQSSSLHYKLLPDFNVRPVAPVNCGYNSMQRKTKAQLTKNKKRVASQQTQLRCFESSTDKKTKKTIGSQQEEQNHLSKMSLLEPRLQFQPYSDQYPQKRYPKLGLSSTEHCACCLNMKTDNASLMLATTKESISQYPRMNSANSNVIQVVKFNDFDGDFRLVDQPQELWPFLETGRHLKTFEAIRELGSGGCGTVEQVRHKLDNRIYALKKVKLHLKFDPSCERSILQHPAMKEIEAISKLSHENIVGYKGCWIEADEPDLKRLHRIQTRLNKHLNLSGIIDESDEDEPDYGLSTQIRKKVQQKKFLQQIQNLSEDPCQPASEIDCTDHSQEEFDSDCDSNNSMYQLTKARLPFVSLNIMILMDYAEGETLRMLIDNQPENMNRKKIFDLFSQLMLALRQVHSSGLVHRDIKPENIFVSKKSNRLQLGDFGLAKTINVVEKDMPKSQQDISKSSTENCTEEICDKSNQLLAHSKLSQTDLGGTLMYLSPEQRRMTQHGQISHLPREKVDIYASGLVLFEMCGQFSTLMERCNNIDNLINKRVFPKGFKEKFFYESKIITLMTEHNPDKRPSAAHFLDSAEYQCWSFDQKVERLL